MKISDFESGKATGTQTQNAEKILPKDRPKGSVLSKHESARKLSPLEKGMAVAEKALESVPDIREQYVEELKARIAKGEYNVSGQEIADMMLRRRKADRIR